MGGEGRGMLPPVKNEMTAAAKGGKAEGEEKENQEEEEGERRLREEVDF